MTASLATLKKLRLKLHNERNALVEALAALPDAETLPLDKIQRLAAVSTAGAAIAREIAAHEPHLGWG